MYDVQRNARCLCGLQPFRCTDVYQPAGFLLMEKVEVNGPGTHPVYQFLNLGGVGFFVSLFFSLEKKDSQ